MKNKYIIFITVFLITACTGKVKYSSDKPIITVTIEPQRYFVEALTHGYFKVVTMVPQGNSPETYDPTFQQMVNLSNSTAYFRIGYIGFEQNWMHKLASNSPHLMFYDTSQHINLIKEGKGIEKTFKQRNSEINQFEPHVWTSPKNAQIILKNVLHILFSLDSFHKKVYAERYDSLQRHIAIVDSFVRKQLSNVSANKTFAIYHPSLSYFARDYGLHQIAIEKEGKEPSPAQLENIISECKRAKVHVVFVQPEFDRRNAEIIAKQIGARVIPINPLNYSWDKEMMAIAKALGGSINNSK